MTDTPLASPDGWSGQLDVDIGTITGGAGSQRLAKAVGKSCVMGLSGLWDIGSAQAQDLSTVTPAATYIRPPHNITTFPHVVSPTANSFLSPIHVYS
jgi:enoyl-CoA hydratase/carnithine racemase